MNTHRWSIVALVKKIPELTVDEYLVLREQAGIRKTPLTIIVKTPLAPITKGPSRLKKSLTIPPPKQT